MKGRKPKPVTVEKPPRLTPPGKLTPAAKAEWDNITTRLSPMKILSDSDAGSLFILATSLAHYREAEEKIAAEGMVVLGPTGAPITNPYYVAQRHAWEKIRPLLAEFGLTPSSRARFMAKKPEGEDGPGLNLD